MIGTICDETNGINDKRKMFKRCCKSRNLFGNEPKGHGMVPWDRGYQGEGKGFRQSCDCSVVKTQVWWGVHHETAWVEFHFFLFQMILDKLFNLSDLQQNAGIASVLIRWTLQTVKHRGNGVYYFISSGGARGFTGTDGKEEAILTSSPTQLLPELTVMWAALWSQLEGRRD